MRIKIKEMEKFIQEIPKMLDMQAKLDNFILQTKGLNAEQTMNDRKVAFVVEMSEMAQEGRWFKYWSEDKEPKTFKINWKGQCKACDGVGRKGQKAEDYCKECDGVGYEYSNPLLEEYVDALHFALSLTNHYAKKNEERGIKVSEVMAAPHPNDTLSETFTFIVGLTLNEQAMGTSTLLLSMVILAEKLELDPQRIVKEYKRKYEENVRRQKEGY